MKDDIENVSKNGEGVFKCIMHLFCKTKSENTSIFLDTKTSVTSRYARRSVMSARGHNGTLCTLYYVRISIMSVMDFHSYSIRPRTKRND